MPLPNEPYNHAVFDELFNEYFSPLCAYCQYKFGLDVAIAKDAVHSAFINLLESNFIYSSKTSSKTFLYKTVTNICLDLMRHEKVKQAHVQLIQKHLTEMSSGEDNKVAELKELQNDINRAIAELPEHMRKVFELSRIEGLKYAEIARKLDISVKTVETQMSRALSKLRQKLSSYLPVYWLLWLIQYCIKK
jgi:RNA polymerase sigma-70 factor (ECF subfamily)